MIIWVLYSIATLLVGLVTILVAYARWHYGKLERLGIPVVRPSFILGSYPNSHKLILNDEDVRNQKRFGCIWGVYEGREPHIYITDLEMIRRICIKDFDHWHDRRQLDFGHILFNEMMDTLPGQKWKVVRASFTPTLTTGKIRHMSHIMKESISEVVDHIKANTATSQEFDFKRIFACLTIDIVAKCAFGTKVSSVNEPDNIFVRMAQKVTGDGEGEEMDPDFMQSVVQTFRIVTKLSPFVEPKVLEFIRSVLENTLQARVKSGVKHGDILDILNEILEKTHSKEYKALGINVDTVLAQAVIFLVAGFQTTATTLTMLSFHLAKHPAVQERLIDEVDAYFSRNDGVIEHETLGELSYLHACMNETLRLTPPLIRLERVCQKDWTFPPTGLRLKKGQVVIIPVAAVHYDPNNYAEPEEFRPDRFLPENKEQVIPYSFLPFGEGLRNCIGMRFSQEEIKLTMATILRDYAFEPCSRSEVRLKPGRLFLAQMHPVYLNVVKRRK